LAKYEAGLVAVWKTSWNVNVTGTWNCRTNALFILRYFLKQSVSSSLTLYIEISLIIESTPTKLSQYSSADDYHVHIKLSKHLRLKTPYGMQAPRNISFQKFALKYNPVSTLTFSAIDCGRIKGVTVPYKEVAGPN